MAFWVSLSDDPAPDSSLHLTEECRVGVAAADLLPSEGNPLVVEVSNLAGPLCSIAAKDEWTVYNLKQGIAEATGVHPTNQKLLLNGEVLAAVFAKLRDVFQSDQGEVLLVRVQDLYVRFAVPIVCEAADYLVENMTVTEAKDRCTSLDCQGFVYYGSSTEESLTTAEIHFKKKVSLKCAHSYAPGRRGRSAKLFVNTAETECRSMLLAFAHKERQAIQFIQQRDMIEELVKDNFFSFEFVCQGLRDDPEIIQAAAVQNPAILKYASKRQLDNKDLFEVAVHINGLALQYASKTLRADRNIVIAAISENPGAFRFADDNLQNDKEIVLHLVARRGKELQHVQVCFKSDKEVVFAAVRQHGDAIKSATPDLQQDEEVIAEARSQLLRSKFK